MAKKPKPTAVPTAKIIREEVVGLTPPRLDPSAARALEKAQAAVGHDAPPIVAASLAAPASPAETDAPPPPPPAQEPPAGDAGQAQ